MTSSRVMISFSPALFCTVQMSGSSISQQGGLIQFNGLYARSSEWIDTEPSALISSSR